MEPSDSPSLLIRALRQVLYPLVRLTLSKGVTYPQVLELLKAVFVEVAESEFKLSGKTQTDSRISLLTGVHRKDVKRLRTTPATEESVTSRSIPLAAQVVSRWSGDPDFLDSTGHPRSIPRFSQDGNTVSFEGLVSSISKDIRSRALLDEWLRLGIVEIRDGDQVSLNLDAFVPQAGIEEKLFYFGHNLHDHAAAASQNICGDGKPHLERSVHYNGMTVETIEKLSKMAENGGMELLLDMNRVAARAAESTTEKNDAPQQRFTFGIYFYNTPDVEKND